jgi:hypothetical protein
MLPRVIRCPKCSMPLFVETDRGYMAQNIIIVFVGGMCGCGQEFIIENKKITFINDDEILTKD